jgi:hypothetical protein
MIVASEALMNPSTDRSPHASLMRDIAGQPLRGFAREFLRESIKATLKYPQTQAVIRLAVAGAILDAVTRGVEVEIVEVYRGLMKPSPNSIDAERVANFVYRHYRDLELPLPKAPAESYLKLFQHEIEEGFRTVVNTYRSVCMDAGMCRRLLWLASKRKDSKTTFPMTDAVESLKAIPAQHANALRAYFKEAVVSLYRDPRQKILHDFLVGGLKSEPRESWPLQVIFPYVATVTKMGMAAEQRSLEGLKMPPRPHNDDVDVNVEIT